MGAGVLTDPVDWVQAERMDWPVILATNSTASVFLMPAIVLVSLMNSGTVIFLSADFRCMNKTRVLFQFHQKNLPFRSTPQVSNSHEPSA